MEQKSIQQIKKIKKMSRAMSIFFKVLQWLMIPLIFIVAAVIIWFLSEPATKAVKSQVSFGGLAVTTHGVSVPDGTMSSAGHRPMSPEGSTSSAFELKVFSVLMAGNTLNLNIKTFLIIIIAILSFFIFKILHHLRKLFRNYAVGDIFSGKSIGQIRQLGFSFLLLGGLQLSPLFLVIQNFRNYIFSENFQIIGIYIRLDNIFSDAL